ncbi:MAG: hypothetical protein CM15mP59_6330 [Flavobacteriaceae bacterium]|nr:MAG: hypothetical protein CM15mP59_6330 [Flavobacteriaceae bacterium]
MRGGREGNQLDSGPQKVQSKVNNGDGESTLLKTTLKIYGRPFEGALYQKGWNVRVTISGQFLGIKGKRYNAAAVTRIGNGFSPVTNMILKNAEGFFIFLQVEKQVGSVGLQRVLEKSDGPWASDGLKRLRKGRP